jgi:hypothetical protein
MRKPTFFRALKLCAAVVAGFAITSHCTAADWFVAPDVNEGSGTRQQPFRDPYLALRAAAPGDVIHVAAGVYYGRYDRSSWGVDRPRITIRGGYDRAFTKRTPWQTPSVFAVFPDYEGTRDPNLITGAGDHAGLTLDGLAFDSGGRNLYGDKPLSGLRPIANADGPIASFSGPGVVIRNCIFANSATGGVELSGEGSRFENNLIVNVVGIYMLNLREASRGNSQSIVVKSNTFAFAHDTGEPPLGRGGNYGIAIRVNCPASITQNAFYACANFAIRTETKADRISVDLNTFWLDNFDVVGKRAAGDEADIAEKNMEELEDVGLKSCKGNKVADPAMAGIKAPWLDAVSRYMLVNYAHPPIEAISAVRAAGGLAAINPPRSETPRKPAAPADPFGAPKPQPKVEENLDAGALAPYLAIADCATFHTGIADRGARQEELKVEFGPVPAATVAQAYQPIEWEKFQRGDPTLANQRVELRAGLGFEQNSYVLNDIKDKEFVGLLIHYPGKSDFETPFVVYVKRGSAVHRQYDRGEKYPAARDVENAYLLRGTCRVDTNVGRQKASLIIDSIVVAPPIFAARLPRPLGRDWFVRAGASGGDGTRDLPFRDPFQALDKAEGGDFIHIAGGDYFGKLRLGTWKISVRNLTILGGYDAGFTARDPWKNPTRLALAEQQKGKIKHGAFLESADVSDGLVLDGLIFDGSTSNKYMDNGALDVAASSLQIMVDLRGGPGDIAVRNCLFLNAAGNAISIHSSSGTFENNIVLNTSGWSVAISADGPGPWVIRNNTILFAADWTPNAGTGRSSSAGTLLLLGGRAKATIESNIFGFADNYGMRCTIAQPHVALNNNVFAGNAYCHLTDTQILWAQSGNWARRAGDSDFAAIQGNRFDPPALALDRAWLDKSLTRMFSLPSRFSPDEWKQIAGALGSSVVPAVSTSAIAPPVAKPAAAKKEASLDDLMADLNKLKEETPGKQTATAGPPYCPAYDWRKALDLASNSPTMTAGARKVSLIVSFTGSAATAAKQYAKATGAQIDAGREQWDGKAIEIDATGMRSSASGGLFPSDISRNDWDAYTITLTTSSGDARTPAAVLVRKDSNASKVMDRTLERDTLHFRGTGRVIPTFRGLCIVVDSVERVDQ